MTKENGQKIGMDLKCIGGDKIMAYEYIGSFKELPKEAKYGSTCYCIEDNCVYIYNGYNNNGIWVELCSVEPNYTTHTTTTITHITYPTNCKNCGAILYNHICEYCGSDNKE